MSKALYNATVIPEVVRLIKNKHELSELEALDAFYMSETAKALNDLETGLYGQSALYIFSVFEDEYDA